MLSVLILSAAVVQDSKEFHPADKDERCIECHADAREETRDSVHAAEGCIGCHGTDEVREGQIRGNPHRRRATFKSWKGRNLTDDCGSCHQSVLQAIRGSEHDVDTRTASQSMKRGCIDCHDYHRVRHSARQEIRGNCRACHEPGSRDYEWGMAGFDSMDGLETTLKDCGQKLSASRGRPGIQTSDIEGATASARRVLTEMKTSQHGLDFIRFEREAREEKGKLAGVLQGLADRERAFARRWAGLAIFLLLTGAAVTSILLRRRPA